MLKYVKAIAAAVTSFVVTVGFVWQDEAVTFDELNLLKAALLSILVAAGVALSPKNQE